jgi:predicted secreted hydrolase
MRSSAIAAAVWIAASPPTATPPSTPAPTDAATATSTSTASATSAASATWEQPTADRTWRFPEDHWAKPSFRNEWWYFTGHLEDVADPARRFGFQLTFFRVGVLPRAPDLDSAWATRGAAMAHAAVVDLATGEHRFSEVLWREVPPLAGFGVHPDPLLAWTRAPAGTAGRWTLGWNGAGFDLAFEDPGKGTALRLATRPEKPLVLQGPNGLSRKSASEGFASLYYSFTRLAAEGTLSAGGRTLRVGGRAWMDRELSSSQLAPGQVGWDWFALQLADGRDLMLYVLRREGGAVDFRSATLVDAGGAAEYLAPGEWSVRTTARWRSPRTGATYPSAWEVEVRGERLAVKPRVADQENDARLAGLHYWEGAVQVTAAGGRPAGEGYVELTGYGERNRPPL